MPEIVVTQMKERSIPQSSVTAIDRKPVATRQLDDLVASDPGWFPDACVSRALWVRLRWRAFVYVLALACAARGSWGQEIQRSHEPTATTSVRRSTDDGKRVVQQIELKNGSMLALCCRDTAEEDERGVTYTKDVWLRFMGELIWSNTETVFRPTGGRDGIPPFLDYHTKRDFRLAEAVPDVLGLVYVYRDIAQLIEIDLGAVAGRRRSSKESMNVEEIQQRAYFATSFLPWKGLHEDWGKTEDPPWSFRLQVHGLQYYEGEWHVDLSVRGRHFHLASKSARDEWRVLQTRFGATDEPAE